jgi:hypothetical protein
MHGGTSKRWTEHPNFKHGGRMDRSFLKPWWFKPRPVWVLLYLFPCKLQSFLQDRSSYIARGGRLDAWLVRPGDVSDEAYVKILRRLRREITHCLNEYRAACQVARDKRPAGLPG